MTSPAGKRLRVISPAHELPEAPRGKRGNRSAMTVESSEITAEIVRMRTAKYSFAQIGEAMGMHPSSAYERYRKALSAAPAEAVGELRSAECAAMDQDEQALQAIIDCPPMVVAGSGKVTDQVNADAVTRAIDARTRLRARRARLLGLDAPSVRVEARVDASELEQRFTTAIAALERQALDRARLELTAGEVLRDDDDPPCDD